MPSSGSLRPELERSLSWPPPIRIVTMRAEQAQMVHKREPASVSATDKTKSFYETFDDDSDGYADEIFLSPIKMYEYEDWASDSDDDAEEVEWDAGITDFALFDSDRRRAKETNEQLPSKWAGMLENQTSALERAIARERSSSNVGQAGASTLIPQDMPSLTPDNSPNLRDSLDIESYHGQNAARPSVPNYLIGDIEQSAEPRNCVERESNANLCASEPFQGEHLQSQAKRKSQRPGLRHSRTMSGQVHAWTPPSQDIYTLGEEPDEERREELGTLRRINGENERESRGRNQRRR